MALTRAYPWQAPDVGNTANPCATVPAATLVGGPNPAAAAA
jgi:hypothetical protein